MDSMEEECWEYLDPKSVTRGPFSGARMAVWYEHQMLPEDLGVRHVSSMPFVPIKELFHPPLLPFRSRPRPASQQCQCHWQYQDTRGQLQGPFTSAQMALWFEHSMLPKTLQLRRTTDSAFATILDYFPKPLVPFQSLPMTPSAPSSKAAKAPPMPQPAPVPQPVARQPAPAKGKAGPKGKSAPAPARRQQQQGPPGGWDWSEDGWSAPDKAWWEWSSWNGWSPDGNGNGWEHNGKQQGAEWKGASGEQGPIGASPAKEKGEKGERGATAVQAAFGNLAWGPYAEETDLLPESTVRKVYDEGIVWEERWISPLAVRFSQGKIHPFFHERGPISEVMLQIRLRDDPESNSAGSSNSQPLKRIEPPFPPVRLLHLKEQGVLVTLDNRRLYALQRFALQEWPAVCFTKALVVDELTPTRLRAENRKFTNRVCGLQLEVESRSNAFDTFSWVTEAGHMEAPRYCRPVSMKAVEKAVSLMPMLVVHSLLSPRLRHLLKSRWPLLHLAALVLPNPQKREFVSRRLLLHHVMELAKPSRNVRDCPPTCVGYKAETVVTLSKGKSCVKSRLNLCRPVVLLEGPQPLSDVQRRVLVALLPMFCLPYARSALRGPTRDWVVAFLLAWGKVAAVTLKLPQET